MKSISGMAPTSLDEWALWLSRVAAATRDHAAALTGKARTGLDGENCMTRTNTNDVKREDEQFGTGRNEF